MPDNCNQDSHLGLRDLLKRLVASQEKCTGQRVVLRFHPDEMDSLLKSVRTHIAGSVREKALRDRCEMLQARLDAYEAQWDARMDEDDEEDERDVIHARRGRV